MNQDLSIPAKFLNENRSAFFSRWESHLAEKGGTIPPETEKALSGYCQEIFDEIVENIGTDARLHLDRLNDTGKKIGFKKELSETNLSDILDFYILFKYHFWAFLRQGAANMALEADDVFEIEKRTNLYFDHVFESISFAYVATKEQAVVDLIEKIIK